MDDFDAFARLITALRPWLDQLVVVGGWAHRLHRFHPLAKPPAYLALRTRDADLAFSKDAVLEGDLSAALTGAGFTEELSGGHSPPLTRYSLGEEDAGFYAEFLTPLLGSRERRQGQSDLTLLKAGVTAQRLRHLDVLLTSPWTVRIGPEVGAPIEAGADLRVPNPTSFLVQKLLIHSHRPYQKKAQAVLYIYDTLELFGASLDHLHRLWVNEVRPTIPARTAKRVVALAKRLFTEVTEEIRQAARLPQDRNLKPEGIQGACEYGLGEILATRDS